MWIYQVMFEDEEDEPEFEVKQHGDDTKRCDDCGLHYPSRVDYPSGNSFFHTYSAGKCRTRIALEGYRD